MESRSHPPLKVVDCAVEKDADAPEGQPTGATRAPPRVYLAGFEVFYPAEKARAIEKAKKEICGDAGLEGVFPMDVEVSSHDQADDGADLARRIFHSNLALMETCEGIIANVSPFRGPSADAGTAWELGYFAGARKVSFSYTTCPLTYEARFGLDRDERGMTVDMQGRSDNCMITESVYHFEKPPHVKGDTTPPHLSNADYESLQPFRAVVDAAAEFFDRTSPPSLG